MRNVKRVEIIIGKSYESRVRELLAEIEVPGFTVFEAVAGYGPRGDREGGELTDATVNRYLLTTCTEEQIPVLAEKLEPILLKYGGLCLISDAQVIRNKD